MHRMNDFCSNQNRSAAVTGLDWEAFSAKVPSELFSSPRLSQKARTRKLRWVSGDSSERFLVSYFWSKGTSRRLMCHNQQSFSLESAWSQSYYSQERNLVGIVSRLALTSCESRYAWISSSQCELPLALGFGLWLLSWLLLVASCARGCYTWYPRRSD